MAQRTPSYLWSIITTILVIAAWQCAAVRTHNDHLAPRLQYLVAESYPSFALFGDSYENNYCEATRTLVNNICVTVVRAFLGLCVGIVIGVAAGLLVYSLTRAKAAARLLLAFAVNIPLFSLVPLFVYWFAGGQAGVIVYIAFAVAVTIAIATYEATLNIPPQYFWTAALTRANATARLRTIILPAILPELLTTFRWVLGLLWAFSLGAEYLSSQSSGCGWLAYQSYIYADVGKLVILAIVYFVLGSGSLFVFYVLTQLGRFLSKTTPLSEIRRSL